MTLSFLSRRDFLAHSTRLLVTVLPLLPLACACSEQGASQAQQAGVTVEDGTLILDLAEPALRPLKTPGNGVKIRFPGEAAPIIVTRVSAAQVAAFSSVCTHAGYEVNLPSNGRLMCSSGHGGIFDLKGQVVHGPPKSPLAPFNAVLEDDRIVISQV